MGNTGLTIMLIEDNPGDVRLTREALRDLAPRELLVAEDGFEALQMLRAGLARGERPDLILLDLNLPGKHGHEVLDEVKQDRDLRTIPVIIVTSSSSQEDVRRSYELHANCYITKPSDLDRFFEVMRGIDHFWLNLVLLPEPVPRPA
jgi:two-component system, chemotaxis family, response regulator Rcp1